VNTRIGPYEIIREVARGGMGVVFQVRHPNVPRPLALKLILDQSVRTLQRFQREAQILAQCDRHPNVLKVHQLGEDRGRAFLVTDFVEGQPLSKAMPLEPKRAAIIIRKVADALAHVHAKGVFHRDVKPENILIRNEAPDEPVLIDFGLARAEDSERLTRTGATLGTPAYMSPEQASAGKGPPVDARSDVYSLGATLYAALTGGPPFQGDSLAEVVAKIMTEAPQPPSDSHEGIPHGLDAICVLALAKKQEARYQTAADMRDDLDRFLKGERPLALDRVKRRWKKKNLAAMALVAVVALVGLGLASVFLAEKQRAASKARALAAAQDAAKAAAIARRAPEAAARFEAFEKALQAVDPHDARLDRVVALLGAELAARDARDAGASDVRTRALDRAGKAALAYLAAPAAPDELLDELPEREAALAAALADGGSEEAARSLLERTAQATGAAAVERARALLRLGHPAAAVRALGALEGPEALPIKAVALLEAREIALARGAAERLVVSLRGGDPAARARARAIAARVELAAGDLAAAERALDPALAADPESILARAELDLAMRAPARPVAAALGELAQKTRDEGLLLRTGELLARARLLDLLEDYGKREGVIVLDAVADTAREALARIAHAGSMGSGAETGRAAAGRALVLLAALDGARRDEAAVKSDLARGLAVAPASIDLALLLAARGEPADLERTSVELPALAPACAALSALRQKPAADTLGGLASAAAALGGAAERAAFALAGVPLAAAAKTPVDVPAVLAAEDALRGAGTLDALLVEIGEERVAFEEDAEGLIAYGLAALKAGEANPEVADMARFEWASAVATQNAARSRGDAAVAESALSIALAWRPGWRTGRLLRAAAVAQLVRSERTETFREAKSIVATAPTAAALAERRGGPSALAQDALADADAGRVVAVDGIAAASAALVRGRLLLAMAKAREALGTLKEAEDGVDTVLAKRESLSLARIAAATRIRSSALSERCTAAERGGDTSLQGLAGRADVDEDLVDRGKEEAVSLASARDLGRFDDRFSGVNGAQQVGVDSDAAGEILTRRDATWRLVRTTPLVIGIYTTCSRADGDAGRIPRAWVVDCCGLLMRGARGYATIDVVLHFGNYIGTDVGGNVYSVDAIDALAGESPPGDATAPFARGVRRILELTPDKPTEERVRLLAQIDKELVRARRLAPGALTVKCWRAVEALAAGRVDLAVAQFEAVHALGAWTTNEIQIRSLEAWAWCNWGKLDLAKRTFAAIRDAQDSRPGDNWLMNNRMLLRWKDVPELEPYREILARQEAK